MYDLFLAAVLLGSPGIIAPGVVAVNPYNFPIGTELHGELGIGAFRFAVHSRVDIKNNVYIYTYGMKNQSAKTTKATCVTWGIVDAATSCGVGIGMMWQLKPQQEAIVILKHPQPPKYALGHASMWLDDTHDYKDLRKDIEQRGVKLPVVPFWHRMRFSCWGPLPGPWANKFKGNK